MCRTYSRPVTAAAMALIAAAPAVCHADIVYRQLAPLVVHGHYKQVPPPTAEIDLNEDGVLDLQLRIRGFSAPGPAVVLNGTVIVGLGSTGILRRPDPGFPVQGPWRLTHGEAVGPASPPFVYDPQMLWLDGPWVGWPGMGGGTSGSDGAVIGLQFPIGNHMHYAWLRIASDAGGITEPGTITVTEYAWETTPGMSILAGAVPAPGASLPLIFAAAALARRRRREAVRP